MKFRDETRSPVLLFAGCGTLKGQAGMETKSEPRSRCPALAVDGTVETLIP
jgi:hypothetical protein